MLGRRRHLPLVEPISAASRCDRASGDGEDVGEVDRGDTTDRLRRARAEAPTVPQVTRSRTAITCSVVASSSTCSRLSASPAATPRSKAEDRLDTRVDPRILSDPGVAPLLTSRLDWLSAHDPPANR